MVTGTIGNCSSQAEVTIEVISSPEVVVFASENELCDDREVVLTAEGAESYMWSDDLGEESTVTSLVISSTTFSVTGASNGCLSIAEYTVEFVDSPEPEILELDGILETSVYDSYQWYFEGEEIDGETDQSIQPQQTGEYSVHVIGNNGCEGEGFLFFTYIGVGEYSQNQMQVYPNPSDGNIKILNSTSGSARLTIYDVSGRVIQIETTDKIGVWEVDASYLSDGIYTYTIHSRGELSTGVLIFE